MYSIDKPLPMYPTLRQHILSALSVDMATVHANKSILPVVHLTELTISNETSTISIAWQKSEENEVRNGYTYHVMIEIEPK